MVYHRVGSDILHNVTHPVPLKRLVDFQRIDVATSGQASVHFTFSEEYLVLTNQQGQEVVYAGTHYLDVFDGVNPAQTFVIHVGNSRIVRENAP
jgi:hypothetical protein